MDGQLLDAQQVLASRETVGNGNVVSVTKVPGSLAVGELRDMLARVADLQNNRL